MQQSPQTTSKLKNKIKKKMKEQEMYEILIEHKTANNTSTKNSNLLLKYCTIHC